MGSLKESIFLRTSIQIRSKRQEFKFNMLRELSTRIKKKLKKLTAQLNVMTCCLKHPIETKVGSLVSGRESLGNRMDQWQNATNVVQRSTFSFLHSKSNS